MKIRRIVPDLHGDPAGNREFYEDVIGLELGMDLGWVITFGSTSNETAQLTVMSEDAAAPVARTSRSRSKTSTPCTGRRPRAATRSSIRSPTSPGESAAFSCAIRTAP